MQQAVARTVDLESEIDFHRGNTLWKLANTYDSLPRTIIEGVQNSIDGAAQRILVGIDYQQRRVIVADDGLGVDKLTFERALRSVGQTIKRTDQLGRFGLGLISPLNKCANFTFESVPMPGQRGGIWTFAAKAIKAQSTKIAIPYQEVFRLPRLHRTFQPYATDEFNVIWRTVVTMNSVVEDKVITTIDLDDLQSEILAKLGTRMREKSVMVRVVLIDQKRTVSRDISATAFAGEKLKLVKLQDDSAGMIEFELYRAQKLSGKRNGQVTVTEMNNPAAISIRDLARQARSSKWRNETEPALTALLSGYFEGVIRCQNVSMHPERTKFENNDALAGLFYGLGLWFEEHGKKYFNDEQEVAREKRYQELGLRSQSRILELLNRPEGAHLREAMRSIEFGRLGSGHVKPSSGRPNGFEEVNTIRVGQGGAGKPRAPKPVPTPPRLPQNPLAKDRPGDVPLGVAGPDGQRRRLVRADSQGLWYEYSSLPASKHLWEFDFGLGVLTFNIRSPDWVRLDLTNGNHLPKNAKWLLHLQEWLTLEVLMLMARCSDPDIFDDQRSSIDNKIKPYIAMFITASH